jgi:hypothetical protein
MNRHLTASHKRAITAAPEMMTEDAKFALGF